MSRRWAASSATLLNRSATPCRSAKDGLAVMINRREDDRSGISERYRLHYCRAFQIPADSYGDPATLAAPHVNGSARQTRAFDQARGADCGMDSWLPARPR